MELNAGSCLLSDFDIGTSGYLRSQTEDFALVLPLTSAGGIGRRFFYGSPELQATLKGREEVVAQRLRRGSDDAAFFTELHDLVYPQNGATPQAHLPPAGFYEFLVSELDAVGWDKLIALGPFLDELQLQLQDGGDRRHVITLLLPPDYPRAAPQVRVTLPGPFEVAWPQHASTGWPTFSLGMALDRFLEALAKHQLLWDLLDDIDAHVWVLEPLNPTRDCVTRRVAIGAHCSLQIALHIVAPSSLPELHFLGADRLLNPLRQALNANLGRWQLQRSIRENLEDVLQITFPSPQQAEVDGADAFAVECAICYNYRLDDDAVPNCACDGCDKPFHGACLSEWLRALPTTQQSFSRLFGECPYCSQPITVEVVAHN